MILDLKVVLGIVIIDRSGERIAAQSAYYSTELQKCILNATDDAS